MDPTQRAGDLPEQLRAADGQAATEIFARYAQRLGRLAERHLNGRLRSRVDGEDIVQSVMQTFFKRSARGEFQIDSSAQIWQLLVRITLMRVRAKARQHTADRRNVMAEQAVGDAPDAEVRGRDPDPVDAAILVETIQQLVSDLPPLYAQVLELRLAGYSAGEIAERAQVSRRTVYRAIELLQERLGENGTQTGSAPIS
jgi:RNA polymerase sigma factor (sigma-70 family)